MMSYQEANDATDMELLNARRYERALLASDQGQCLQGHWPVPFLS
jgi:hypothetical protein